MSKVRRNTHSSEDLSSSSGTSSSLSSDEEIDARDLKPIKDYLSDRKELARQLFKSVKPEKIRMMLPQTLKKMDLDELEEWCASELSGMSRTRILCILNGKPMLESSDTNESDDSGPSLEIISDTEEWFTDDDMSKKEDGSQPSKVKTKKDRVKLRGKAQPHKKNDAKLNCKTGTTSKEMDIQIKKEEETETGKEKEGDSLLDLLELEMRARAIRALIRKEEDVIPTSSASKSTNNGSSNENNVIKTAQDEFKDKENCRRQLEKIISAQRGSAIDDEDVVLVVQPTPTIELLSSDSEGEGHSGRRINQKLQNERTVEREKNTDHVENENLKNVHNAATTEKLEENKNVEGTTEPSKDLDPHKHEVSKRVHSNNVDNKDIQSPSTIKPHGKRRKVKRKSHTKQQLNLSSEEKLCKVESCDASQNTNDIKSSECSPTRSVTENVNGIKSNKNEPKNLVDSKITNGNPLSVELNGIKKEDTANKIILDEDKSTDLDEIIDLDDYCDDMEDMENTENDKGKNKQVTENEQQKSKTEICPTKKSKTAETWASRYYQTDDVQSVIKESKIQSEIRKRLRERQRLSKLNKSPNENSPSSPSVTEATSDILDQNPLGSVDEYLALKRTASMSLSISSSNNGSNVMQDTDVSNDTCTDENTVIKDTHTAVTNSKETVFDKETDVSGSEKNSTSLITKEVGIVNPDIGTNPA